MEIDEVIAHLSDIAEMPIFQRNGATEYEALMTAIALLQQMQPEQQACEYYSTQEMNWPRVLNGQFEMVKVVKGKCAVLNDFCDCEGDKTKCKKN